MVGLEDEDGKHSVQVTTYNQTAGHRTMSQRDVFFTGQRVDLLDANEQEEDAMALGLKGEGERQSTKWI